MVRLAIAAGIGADTLSAKTVSSVTRPVVALQGTPFHAQHGTVEFQPESPGGLPRADFTASKAMPGGQDEDGEEREDAHEISRVLDGLHDDVVVVFVFVFDVDCRCALCIRVIDLFQSRDDVM
jgi:hypothetical protein